MVVGTIIQDDKTMILKCEVCGKITRLYMKRNHGVQAGCSCNKTLIAKNKVKEHLIKNYDKSDRDDFLLKRF